MMGLVRDLSEKLWRGEATTEEHHPMAPMMLLEELAPGVRFLSSFANVTAFDTSDGLLLVDTGGPVSGPHVFGALRGWSARPLHTAIYTHGHIDHVMGIDLFEAESEGRGWPAPRVVAHEAVPARFDRYLLTRGYNSCINGRQFGGQLEWPARYRYPDVTYRDTLELEVGGQRFELHHARGETDDATWVFAPESRVLATGDLFIWATPNAGNPQKVQRYVRPWAQALRRMASLGAEVLSPGHGWPIFGAARVRQALEETAELLESLHDQTVAKMNEGARLDEVLRTVRAPQHLLERPYLRPVYDEPEFLVHNLWRQYGGWWDGNPAHLKPAPAAELAAELARLTGGAARLCARARELAEAGNLRLACELVELAGNAAPDDEPIRRTRQALYRQRAESERSLMARGIFRAAADE